MAEVKVGGTGWALLLFLLSLVACLQRIVADCRSLVSVRLSNTAIADVVEEVSAAMEARDAGKDAFRLGVVAGTVGPEQQNISMGMGTCLVERTSRLLTMCFICAHLGQLCAHVPGQLPQPHWVAVSSHPC